MKYDLPEEKIITVEYEGRTMEISDYDDVGIIENILVHSKYYSEICDGIDTHKITLDDEVYYLKENCGVIQKGEKQAKITKEDLDEILKIINGNQ